MMRLLKILSVVLLAGIAVFVLLNLWLDSRENLKAYYATSADAERDKIAGADAFARGWLPVVLKSGVSEIREEHNVSTNQGRATFRYSACFHRHTGTKLCSFTARCLRSQPLLALAWFLAQGRHGCKATFA
ncbi:MAG: hypothetical protein DMG71_16165 [Acidobacteria bacterium]|nr:MAG: hypothetical protein DMG71_16165 [Acidobacteriota bacterium]